MCAWASATSRSTVSGSSDAPTDFTTRYAPRIFEITCTDTVPLLFFFLRTNIEAFYPRDTRFCILAMWLSHRIVIYEVVMKTGGTLLNSLQSGRHTGRHHHLEGFLFVRLLQQPHRRP